MFRALLIVGFLLCCAPAGLAQVDWRPAPAPTTGAADRDWFRAGQPIPFAGDLYYPSGPTVYFNGNSMVPTGEYDGVTLYADTMRAPYSLVLVPVSGRALQPYVPQPSTEKGAPQALRSYEERGTAAAGSNSVQEQPPEEGWRRPQRYPFDEVPAQFRMETIRKPEDSAGIWLAFEGHRWQQEGEAVALDAARMAAAGEYRGFVVYADPREPYVIYVPSRANLVARFRRVNR